MEYRTYTTDAIVLAVYPHREADRQLILLTRDLGMVRAVAKNTRSVESKLRFALQWGSLSRVSMVYGRTGWRITNALPVISFAGRLRSASEAHLIAAARGMLLARRLVAGEERDERLFFIMLDMFTRLSAVGLHEREVTAVEHVTALRILAELGYIGTDQKLGEVLKRSSVDRGTCRAFERIRPYAVRVMNTSLEATQLV